MRERTDSEIKLINAGLKPQWTIAVIGASGLAGSTFCKLAMYYRIKVVCFVRTSSDMDFLNDYDSTLYQVYHINFEEIDNNLSSLYFDPIDAAVSFLEVRKNEVGGKERYSHLQHSFVTKFALHCRDNRVDPFILCSCFKPPIRLNYYFKTKRDIEDEVASYIFDNLLILRPGRLIGKRPRPKGIMDSFITCLCKVVKPKTTCTKVAELALVALLYIKNPGVTRIQELSAKEIRRICKLLR